MERKDENIIQSVLDGQVNDFRFLVRRYEEPLLGLCIRLTQDREKAKALLQDAFIAIYTHLPSYKYKSKFSTWAYTITYRTVAKSFKEKKKNKLIEWMDEWDNEPFEEASLDFKPLQEQLKKLNPAYQNLVTWFYFENLTIAEISEITGYSNAKIKTSLHRIRTILAKELKTLSYE